MDVSYLMCSLASPYESASTSESVVETGKPKQSLQSVAPDIVESSGSETSHVSDRSVDFSESTPTISTIAPPVSAATKPSYIPVSKPGETSPSSLPLRRKLSTGIATDPTKKHPVLEGRPVIIPRNLSGASISERTAIPACSSTAAIGVTSKSNANDPNMAIAVRAKPPNSAGQARPDHVKRDVSLGTRIPSTVSPPFHNGNPSNSNDNNKRSGEPPRPCLRRSYTTASERDVYQRFHLDPSPLRLEAWSAPAAEDFQVRGKTYINDKVKVPSQASFFRLLTVDLINSPRPLFGGLCSHPHERVQQALKREMETGVRELPDFVFCVNLCVPGQSIYHSAFYFGIDTPAMEEIKHGATPTGRIMKRFLFGDDDEFRDKTFKLIPRIIEGNYIVRKSVGSKPSILGKKIKQYYIRSDRFMEVIVDIASDPMAQRIVKLCLGYIKTIVVDMMFVLEGYDESTLPERIFGGVRLKNIDFKEKDGKRIVAAI